MRTRLSLLVSASLALAVFLAALVATAPTIAIAQTNGFANLSDAFEQLTQQVTPAVVQIFVTRFEGTWVGATTQDLLARQHSTGSGVVVDPNGYIITNAHVVRGGRRVQVLLHPIEQDERSSILKARGQLIGAQIVGIDTETDLAVLKLQQSGLPYLEIGDSDELRQGELVMAFGSPLGLRNSVSFGVVSSVARQLRPEDPMIYIQTDASINPGNSGGPLVNTEGKIVGINTFILTRSGGDEGIGFAAPSNIVKNVYDQIKSAGRVRRGEIGVHSQTITPTLAAALKLDRNWGVVLGDVLPGSPAARAGLEVGDVVLALDGKPMENGRQFDVNLYSRNIGQTVSLDVLRGGKQKTIRVAVIERAESPDRFANRVSPEKNLVPELGILGLDIDDALVKLLPRLRSESGVLVAALAADAPFWGGGLAPGDIIHAVNGQQISSLAQLRRTLAGFEAGDPVALQVERLGGMRFVAFEFE